MKYIDADKLIAEIERKMKNYNASIEKYYNKQKSIKAERDSWKWAECKWFLNLINSLKQEQPSLPSNLDEAAEENFETMEVLEHENIFEETHRKIFKAGAEWMAGQYEKIEGELVDWYSTSEGKDYCCGIKTSDPFVIPEGFYIRKKQ